MSTLDFLKGFQEIEEVDEPKDDSLSFLRNIREPEVAPTPEVMKRETDVIPVTPPIDRPSTMDQLEESIAKPRIGATGDFSGPIQPLVPKPPTPLEQTLEAILISSEELRNEDLRNLPKSERIARSFGRGAVGTVEGIGGALKAFDRDWETT